MKEAAESDDETDIKDSNNGDKCQIHPLPHECAAGNNCPIGFCGLSLFDENGEHPGVEVSGIADASFPGLYWMKFDGDKAARIALIKLYEKMKPKKKEDGRSFHRQMFGCFSLDTINFSSIGLQLVNDGGLCERAKPGHHTLFPIASETLKGEVWKVNNTPYGYYPPLLTECSWKPHCMKMICQAEPRQFDFSFNRDLWNACLSTFNYMKHMNIPDYQKAMTVCKFLSVMEECGYRLTSAATERLLRGELFLVAGLFHEVAHNAITFEESKYAMVAEAMLYYVVDLYQSPRNSVVVMYGDSQNEDEDFELTDSKLPLSSRFEAREENEKSFELAKVLLFLQPHFYIPIFLQIVADRNPHCVIEKGSVVIYVNNIPEKLASDINSFLSSNLSFANALQNATVGETLLPVGNCAFLGSDVRADENLTASVIYQRQCKTFLSIMKTSPMTAPEAKKMCRMMVKCIVYFRDQVWRRHSQRIMVLCLSRSNVVNVGRIYTDDYSQYHDGHFSSWLKEVQSVLRSSSTISALLLTRGGDGDVSLRVRDNEQYFLLVTFDATEVLHHKATKLLCDGLQRSGVSVVENEELFVPFLDVAV